MSNKIKWSAFLDAIEQEKCVLCIGPGIFTNKNGLKLEEQILTYLESNGELDGDIISYPDGLFYFRRESKRNNVLSDLDRFFREEFDEVDRIYRKLVQIPFNLVLFLTPDRRFCDIAEEEKIPFYSDFYFKHQPPRSKEAPRKSFPIAYNLFGSFQNDESIVLTYDDLFDFMQSIFEGNSMSDNLRSSIRQARHFVFLGLPFDKWYMQLLLRVLQVHTNRRLTKYAANTVEQTSDIQTFFKDQFDITFVEDKVESFVDEMVKVCQTESLVRLPSSINHSTKERVRNLVSDNELDESMDVIEDTLRKENRFGESLEDQIAHLKRRLRMNKEERIKGIIPDSEFRLEQMRLTDNILEILNSNF